MRFIIILITLFILPAIADAQLYTVEGKVTNNKMEPLAFATVQLKEQRLGTNTDQTGHYKLRLESGTYDLVFSLIGYKTETVKIIVEKKNITRNIILDENSSGLGEVKISMNRKDKAEEYIREVIKHKTTNRMEMGSYSCQVYIKATEVDEQLKGKSKEDSDGKKKKLDIVPDSLKQKHYEDSIRHATDMEMGKMSMAEIFLTLHVDAPDKVKEIRNGVKRNGNTDHLFYRSTTEGDFSLYQNLIRVPALSETPFLSPVSYSGLVAYKFKTLHTDKRSRCNIYTIRFTPIKAGNALIEGTVTVVDTSWAILDCDYRFPAHLMNEYDYFEAVQSYEMIENKSWMLDRMELKYFSKKGKTKSNGKTIAIFDKYVLDTTFKKKYFNSELSITTLEAYERDSNFWNTIRKEPLSNEEMKFIRYKDSVYERTHTKAYLDSIDKKNNRVTVKDILIDGIAFYKRAYDRTLYLAPLTSMWQPLYPGGSRIGYSGSYSRRPKSRKTYSFNVNASYGQKQRNWLGGLSGWYRYNPFSNGYIAAGGGRDIDLIFNNDSYVNILRRSNFFLKNYFHAEHGLEIVNGLVLRNRFEMALRQPISINGRDSLFDQFFGSLGSDRAQYSSFDAYNAFYGSVTLEYTPKQMYMREPREKIILGSKWPTFYATWRKGIPGVLNSNIHFNYVEYGLSQRLKLGLLGISEYKIHSGAFLTKQNLQTIDYKFIRRGDPVFFTSPSVNFQSLDSSFAIFKPYYEGHYMHEFFGSLINKIPYAKKLRLYEVAGAGSLYAPERNLIYFEMFAGIEKPFKLFGQRMKLGGYVVSSFANQSHQPFQFKVGLQSYNETRNRWE